MDLRFKTVSNGSAKMISPKISRPKRTLRSQTGKNDDHRLKKACADFEGIFLNQMIQTMRKTIPEGGIFGKSHQSDMYETIFLQEISIKLARERGLGLGDALYRQVRHKIDMKGENKLETADGAVPPK